MKKRTIWQQYKVYLKQAKWKIPATLWIIIGILFGIGFGIIVWLIIITFPKLDISPLLAVISFIVITGIIIGWPYFKAEKIIDSIEDALPDALKQMSDTLKAGGTYEYALREVTNSDYGPLTDEMSLALRRLEEGENLETSLRGFANSVESKLVKRSINIIIDSIKAGAGLADVLDEISDDIREMHRIKIERKSLTLMQVLFMVAAGGLVAPFIFGLVSSLISFFVETSSVGLNLSKTTILEATKAKETIVNLMQLYILIEVSASGAMMAMMRDGKLNKSIIYIPVLLLFAYLIFYGARFVGYALIGGS